MATFVKLHLCPETSRSICFFSGHHHRRRTTSSLCRGGFGSSIDRVSLKLCRAFRAEDGGDLKEKKNRNNSRKDEVKLKRENGFWGSIGSIMLGTFKLASKSDDEYRLALAKVEEVLSSVS